MTVTAGGHERAEAAVAIVGVTVALGGRTALADVDITLSEGESVALVGPSGAGKTTALSLCNAMVTASAGSVRVLGQDISTADRHQLRDLRGRIGTVHQHLSLVGPLRVVHNVNAGCLGSWSRRRATLSLVKPHEPEAVLEVLARVGIADKLNVRLDRLSGGEQQRVAIARVLRQDPELILADEPVSSLDPARSEEMMRLLCQVAAERSHTLLVSLHDFELARRWCDRLVGLRDGKVMFDLPAGEVTDRLGRDLYRI